MTAALEAAAEAVLAANWRAARRSPRAASTRTSGAGTRPTSRSAGRGSTRRVPRPSSSRCCAASGPTAACRTSSSTPTCRRTPTSRGPRSGTPTSDGVATSGLTQPPLHARAALEVARRSARRRGVPAARVRAPGRPARVPGRPPRRGRRRAGGDRPPVGVRARQQPGVGRAAGRGRAAARGRRRPTSAATAATSTPASGPTTPPMTASCTSRARTATPATRTTGAAQFLVEDPLFNAIWLWSTHALVEIAELIGEDPAPHREAARSASTKGCASGSGTASASCARDLRTDRLIERRTVLSLAPLLDPDLPARGRARGRRRAGLAALPGAGRARRGVLRPARPRVRARAATGAARSGPT